MSRRSLAVGLDVLALALAVILAIIVFDDGFRIHIFDLRLSFRRPSRTLIWLAAAMLARFAVDRQRGPFGSTWTQWRRVFWGSPGHDDRPVRVAPGMWRRTAFAAAGIAVALAALLHEQLRQMYSVPDLGDPLFSVWRIGWVLHQLVTNPSHLFDANIFHPERLTLTFSDPMILPALMAAPFLAVGVHPVVVYNLLLISAFWISGVATYLLVERLTGSARSAFVAGLIYAVYSFRFEHYSHLELQMTQWMPLGLLALHLFITTRRWPYALAFGLACVAQLYSSMYYAVFFLLFAGTIGIGLLVAHRPPLRALLLPTAATALIALLIATPLIRSFIAAQPVKGERPVAEVTYYSARPADYFRGNRHSAIWREHLRIGEPERALFPGAAPLVVAAIGLAPPFSAVRLVYLAGLVFAVDASLGFNGFLYPHLYEWSSAIRGLRVPARFAALVGLALAIFAGFGARRVFGWWRHRTGQHAVLAALVVAIVVDAWPFLPLMPVWKTPPSIYAAFPPVPRAVLAEFPLGDDESFNLPFMYFSLWHWTPMVNGYSGFIPKSYAEVSWDLLQFPGDDSVATLRRRGVTHVTVNCGLGHGNCPDLLERARHSRHLRLLKAESWEQAPVELYELIPDRGAAPDVQK